MKHGSLFSGIGGFDLAAQWMGWENVFQVENDKFCQKVLEKNLPNVKRYGDIREFDGTEYRGLIDILTGGIPCQPFSVAGKQRGKSDHRWLWPEMFRVVREICPPWVIVENPPGIIKLALEDICLALEGEAYEVQPFIIPSASIGAWDKRDRVWIIAYNNKFRCNNEQKKSGEIIQNKIRINEKQTVGSEQLPEVNPDPNKLNSDNAGHNSGTIPQQQKTKIQFNSNIDSKSMEGHSWYELTKGQKDEIRRNGQSTWLRDWIEVASELCRSNARVPHRMERIKALGNSVNPYVAYELFKAIENELERGRNFLQHDTVDRQSPEGTAIQGREPE